MFSSRQHLIFTLEGHRYTLPLPSIDRVVPAVYITPLPKAPEVVLGVINVQGQIIPVVNLRKRFRLPEREIEPSDQFIVAHTSHRVVALSVDAVLGVSDLPEQIVISGKEIVPGMEYIAGVAKQEDGVLLIHDLDTCLSLDEEKVLDSALPNVEG